MVADEIVTQVRARGGLPVTTKLTDQNIIDAANEELIEVEKDAIDAGQELLTVADDTKLVPGQAAYPFPTRAAGATARHVSYLDVDGVSESDPLDHVELSDIYKYPTMQGTPEAFYLLDGQIVLLPPPSQAGSLRMRYSRMLSALVLDTVVSTQHSAVAKISNINTGTGAITLTAATNGFLNGLPADVTQAYSPYRPLARDLVATAPAGTSLTFTAPGGGTLLGTALTAYGFSVGDYITLARTSYVPQLPRDWHSLLVLRTVRRLQAGRKDYVALQEVGQHAKTLGGKVANAGQPRVAQNPKRISAWRGLGRWRY